MADPFINQISVAMMSCQALTHMPQAKDIEKQFWESSCPVLSSIVNVILYVT
jgi:hypothetical protein